MPASIRTQLSQTPLRRLLPYGPICSRMANRRAFRVDSTFGSGHALVGFPVARGSPRATGCFNVILCDFYVIFGTIQDTGGCVSNAERPESAARNEQPQGNCA